MKIEYISGCINDFVGIDGIREVDMSEEQRKEFFNKIIKELPKLEIGWFNYFLQWVCEEFGDLNVSEKPCEQCGEYTTTYTLEIND